MVNTYLHSPDDRNILCFQASKAGNWSRISLVEFSINLANIKILRGQLPKFISFTFTRKTPFGRMPGPFLEENFSYYILFSQTICFKAILGFPDKSTNCSELTPFHEEKTNVLYNRRVILQTL